MSKILNKIGPESDGTPEQKQLASTIYNLYSIKCTDLKCYQFDEFWQLFIYPRHHYAMQIYLHLSKKLCRKWPTLSWIAETLPAIKGTTTVFFAGYKCCKGASSDVAWTDRPSAFVLCLCLPSVPHNPLPLLPVTSSVITEPTSIGPTSLLICCVPGNKIALC